MAFDGFLDEWIKVRDGSRFSVVGVFSACFRIETTSLSVIA